MGWFAKEPSTVATEAAKEWRIPPPKGDPYSVALPGTAKEGRTAIYRHWRAAGKLLETLDPSVRTMHEGFENVVPIVPNDRCLGHRPWDPVQKKWLDYVWQDYKTVQTRRTNVGKGIVEVMKDFGVSGDQYGIGLWCQNRPEWQITDLACMSQSLFTVSIYDQLGPETTEYIINHAELPCVVASLDHIPTLLKIKSRCPQLKVIISLDPLDAGEQKGLSKSAILNALGADVGVKIYSFDEIEKIGQASGRGLNPPSPESTITINYTSGTTGAPKGVRLTHKNAMAAATSSLIICMHLPDSCHISYLPLAHIYERVGEHLCLFAGQRIGFFHGEVLEIVEDLQLLKPSGFTSVPRLYNRFGSSIRAATLEAPRIRGMLSRHVVETKLKALEDPDSPNATNKHAVWDRIWGRKVAKAIGLERAQFMVSGSAPLDPQLHQFLRVVFGNHFVQGYGLTESYAVSFAQLQGDLSTGNIGPPAPCVEAILIDVPDMDYLTTDQPFPRGELCLRGPSLFKGYHKNDAETEKSFTEDGFFKTGDIATMDALGRFSIIDRRKNVLKLAQGEYVSPERIENVYLGTCGWIEAAYVHGDSNEPFLVMIGAIMPELFAPWASKILGGPPLDMHDKDGLRIAAASEKVQRAALQELDEVGRKNKFNSFERVRGIKLLLDPFTMENELLTPTMKLKRPQTAKLYRKDLDELYKQANEAELAGKGVATIKAKF